jgi:UDP-glucose 4-epimerase
MPRTDRTRPGRAVVTGGAGFIGSHLVDALVARGDEVLAIDDLSNGRRENLAGALGDGAAFEQADVRDGGAMRRLLREWRPDVVFHLAAQADVTRSVADPDFDAQVNHGGTINVLEAARAAGAERFVFASTGGALYGDADELPTPESAPMEPLAPYGANKLAAEHEVERFGGARMSSVSLRLANVYGPRQDSSGEGGVVAIFSRSLAEGTTPTVFGDGSSTRDYVYVEDVVGAFVAAGDDDATSAFNIGTGRETSVVDLLAALARAAGAPEFQPEHAPEREGEVRRSCLDAGLAARTLGFAPTWRLEDGLRSTYESYARRLQRDGDVASADAPVPAAPARGQGPLSFLLARRRAARNGNGAAPTEPATPSKVLILSADVGEGHIAAARALETEILATEPDAEIEVVDDGLQWLGRFSEHVIRDGYRVQLRFFPWMYGLLYTIFTKVGPIRFVGRGFLRAFAARRLLRKVEERDPDVVISTHPSFTNLLGVMRRQGKLDMPVVATITDLADHIFWAHRHCDLHLVCYEQAVERIEPITGPGSVVRVRPLVSPQFLEPCDRADARGRLDLPADDPIVLVSGGGWGVGDLDGAVQTALDTVPGSLVVVLAGRNEEAQERLEGAFGREPRVRILGFTKEMSDLMAAADAIIHSTGGVTALEALLRQCPVISYGAPWGHSRVNARIAEAQGLGQRAESLEELSNALHKIFDPVDPWQVPLVPWAPPAAPLVLDGTARVRPRPAWLMRTTRVATTAGLAVLAVGWSLNSGAAYSLASKVLNAKPLTRVVTQRQQVALVLRVPGGSIGEVRRALAARGGHASFAVTSAPGRTELAALGAAGDNVVPELARGKTMHWLKTRGILKRDRRALGLPKHFYFLTPTKGFNLGEYLYGRTLGATPVDGAVRISLPSPRVHRPVRRGQVVVVTLDPRSSGSMVSFDRLLTELSREGLSPVSVDDLAGSPSVKA